MSRKKLHLRTFESLSRAARLVNLERRRTIPNNWRDHNLRSVSTARSVAKPDRVGEQAGSASSNAIDPADLFIRMERYERLREVGLKSRFDPDGRRASRVHSSRRTRYPLPDRAPRMILPGLVLALELSGENDADLARRLHNREPRAMTELYDRFGKLAWSVILNIVRDSSIAEDLVQETFLRAWTRIRAFDAERGALGPWLLAIARNRALDYIRSARSRADRASVEFDPAEHPQLFNDMERDLLNSEHAKLLKKAMSNLTDNQRKVIELAYYEGLSQTEMAEKLGQPLGTIKTWTRMALRQLRAQMAAGVAA